MLLRALVAGAFCAGLLSACAVVDPVDNRYDTISRSLAKARNEAIFLNLVRASHDYPLSFTTIANVTPSLTNTSTFGLPSFLEGPGSVIKSGTTVVSTFPTQSPFRDTLFSSTTASNATAVSTNFNVATQETSAFYGGFLKPIGLDTLAYFIRQGYPRELLFWLFTDSFELKAPGEELGFHFKPPDDLGCDPHDVQKHRCFIDWVHNATLNGLTVEEKTQERQSASKGGESGSATAKPTIYSYSRFCFNRVLAREAQALAPEFIKWNRKDIDVTDAELYNGALECGSSSWHPERTANQPQEDILPLKFKGGLVSFRIVPRSAYGVFQFLGTLMRLKREGWDPNSYPNLYPSFRPWAAVIPPPLATVHADPNLITIATDSDCFVHTWFEDGDYCVPQQATTTKQIFSLLAQLIAIQTAASDLSITPVVRVIQ